MDGLALLCALHADGPHSLRRLRRSGCPSLEAVALLDPERLAELLASTPAAAQRFRREAELLLTRLGGATSSARASELLELEDAASEPADAPHTRTRASEGAGRPGTSSAAVDAPESVERSAAARAARRPWDAALARWRELDALEDAEAAAEPIVEESSAPAPHPSPRMPLEALADLAHESRDALIAVGIVDLEALAACDPLELAQATGLDYSNAVRWRALARRALPERVERFSRAEMPLASGRPLVELDGYVLRPTPPPIAAGGPNAATTSAALREPSALREETAGGPFA
jgi:hypothetical protein